MTVKTVGGIFLLACAWMLTLLIQKDHYNVEFEVLKRDQSSREKETTYLRNQMLGLLNHVKNVTNLPVIYVITPTYARLLQKAELTRLKTVLESVPRIHWIVIEDSEKKTPLVADMLRFSKLNITHLSSTTPDLYKLKAADPHWSKPRGVLQRNAGLAWLRQNLNAKTDSGVVFFADDDNTYSPELFEEMRDTKLVSVWPVGLVGGLRYETPVLENGKVVAWRSISDDRPYALDMAGFATNLKLILEKPEVQFNIDWKPGYQESDFINSLGVTLSDLEPKAQMCTQILVWHTRTEAADIVNEKSVKHPANLSIEV